MEVYNQGSVEELLRWKRLYESPLYGPGSVQRKKTSAYAEKQLTQASMVSAKRTLMRGTQHNNTQRLRYSWYGPKYLSKNDFCTSMYPRKRPLEVPILFVTDEVQKKEEKCKPVSVPRKPKHVLEKTEERRLLRRPTALSPICLKLEDERFQLLAKLLNLLPLVINNSPMETLVFYLEHYPLLLKFLRDKEKYAYVKRFSVQGSYLDSAPWGRSKELEKRITDLDKAVEDLRNDTDNGRFITELDSLVFDLRKWPWRQTVEQCSSSTDTLRQGSSKTRF